MYFFLLTRKLKKDFVFMAVLIVLSMKDELADNQIPQ